jgi:hypothetical protein
VHAAQDCKAVNAAGQRVDNPPPLQPSKEAIREEDLGVFWGLEATHKIALETRPVEYFYRIEDVMEGGDLAV